MHARTRTSTPKPSVPIATVVNRAAILVIGAKTLCGMSPIERVVRKIKKPMMNRGTSLLRRGHTSEALPSRLAAMNLHGIVDRHAQPLCRLAFHDRASQQPGGAPDRSLRRYGGAQRRAGRQWRPSGRTVLGSPRTCRLEDGIVLGSGHMHLWYARSRPPLQRRARAEIYRARPQVRLSTSSSLCQLAGPPDDVVKRDEHVVSLVGTVLEHL